MFVNYLTQIFFSVKQHIIIKSRNFNFYAYIRKEIFIYNYIGLLFNINEQYIEKMVSVIAILLLFLIKLQTIYSTSDRYSFSEELLIESLPNSRIHFNFQFESNWKNKDSNNQTGILLLTLKFNNQPFCKQFYKSKLKIMACFPSVLEILLQNSALKNYI